MERDLNVDELTTLDIQELKVTGNEGFDQFLVPDGQASLVSIIIITIRDW